MSRDGSALFGAGTLDQLAIYNQPLSAGTIFQHFNSYGTNKAPKRGLHDLPEPGTARAERDAQRSGSSDPIGRSWTTSGI